MPALRKFVHSLTAWESQDLDRIIDLDYGDAIDVSTFELERDQTIRGCAELYASGGSHKPRSLYGAICHRGHSLVESTPGETRFAFTAAAHRDLKFETPDEVRKYVRDVVLPNLIDRQVNIVKDDLRVFLRERLAANDEEWKAVFETQAEWAKLAKPAEGTRAPARP